jgi:hypothetical protein
MVCRHLYSQQTMWQSVSRGVLPTSLVMERTGARQSNSRGGLHLESACTSSTPQGTLVDVAPMLWHATSGMLQVTHS